MSYTHQFGKRWRGNIRKDLGPRPVASLTQLRALFRYVYVTVSADPNFQQEVVYLTILSIHHWISTGLVMYGLYIDNSVYCLHGAILDLTNSIHDAALMVRRLGIELSWVCSACVVILADLTAQCLVQHFHSWPFKWLDEQGPNDKIKKRNLVDMMVLYHLFSIITVPAIITGLIELPEARLVGVMLAVAVHVSVMGFTRTRNRSVKCQYWQSVRVCVCVCDRARAYMRARVCHEHATYCVSQILHDTNSTNTLLAFVTAHRVGLGLDSFRYCPLRPVSYKHVQYYFL